MLQNFGWFACRLPPPLLASYSNFQVRTNPSKYIGDMSSRWTTLTPGTMQRNRPSATRIHETYEIYKYLYPRAYWGLHFLNRFVHKMLKGNACVNSSWVAALQHKPQGIMKSELARRRLLNAQTGHSLFALLHPTDHHCVNPIELLRHRWVENSDSQSTASQGVVKHVLLFADLFLLQLLGLSTTIPLESKEYSGIWQQDGTGYVCTA